MSLSNEISNKFWTDPPWGDGHKKYRLGLAPIDKEDWFEGDISFELKEHKRKLLETRYEDVIAATADSDEAQNILSEKISVSEHEFPDQIANISLSVPDDLCVIESDGDQRLIAASVCSPSYWNLTKKIGKSLRDIHKPVKTLNKKIGNPIEKFIKNAPLDTPFKRENWFIHGNNERFYLEPEGWPEEPIEEWYVRSERETICKYSEAYSLFAINVRFQPLHVVQNYGEAKKGLIKSLEKFDDEEIEYFGGTKKHNALLKHLHSL
tara:strand:- start:4488 stop:5282 length:795 start_codon:yes stop_codon:yes gene_type:complete